MDVKSILFILRGVLLFACAIILASCGAKERRLPHVSDSLFDLSDTVCIGLPRLEGSEKVLIYEGAGYVNNVVITYFRERYYCMWQDSEQDEDSPDTRVLFSTSPDGRHWERPSVLATPTDSTFVSPGGWINNETSLSAILNYICSSDRSKGGTAWFMRTVDGTEWSDIRPLLMSDGRPMAGILEQDPLKLPDGRTVGAAHLRPGLRVNPVYTDDPTGLTGWKEAAFPGGEGSPLEPSQYMAPDGRLVMFFRDQASSFMKLASVSDDGGESWSPTALTNIPDSRSKTDTGSTRPSSLPGRKNCRPGGEKGGTRPLDTIIPKRQSLVMISGFPCRKTRRMQSYSAFSWNHYDLFIPESGGNETDQRSVLLQPIIISSLA